MSFPETIVFFVDGNKSIQMSCHQCSSLAKRPKIKINLVYILCIVYIIVCLVPPYYPGLLALKYRLSNDFRILQGVVNDINRNHPCLTAELF